MMYNFRNRILTYIIGILGFSQACKPVAAEYGAPFADFIINGTIKDHDTEQLIEGVSVTLRSKTVYSGPNGEFQIIENEFADEQTFELKIEDVDGDLNGSYQNKDTSVVFENPQFTGGDGNWDEGQVEKEVQIKLHKKGV